VPDAQLSATTGPGVGLHQPSVARVYDFLLGGSTNWAIDRTFGTQLVDHFPEVENIARANRQFVNRVVRHLTECGIRQFVDIGSGMFSTGNTHQIADEVAGGTRVVYVDNEAVAVAHAEILLDQEGDPDRHAVVNADLRDPATVWAEALATGVIDADEPVAVLMFSVLHNLRPAEDDPAARIVSRYRDLMPTGSYLGVSHVTDQDVPADLAQKLLYMKKLSDEWCGNRSYCRSHAAVRALLGDFELVCPGMGWIADWQPDKTAGSIRFPAANHSIVWAGVGRKPASRR
jgi:O-methyltransferase involved in polyketide biosynthesis